MREKRKNKKWLIMLLAIVLVVLIAVGVSVKASASNGIAKSVTFTDNMDGYYVYFRAVDSAGNVGDWSNAQRIWIDTTTPTVTAKENSVTIKEGDVNELADYFTVVANGTNTDVDVVCTIGGVAYTTTESLTVDGSPYTVTCTATKNGGKSNKAEMELVVEPSGPPAWDGTIASGFARGNGSQTSPYEIETPQQLAYLASSVNSGTTYEGKYFEIVNELDLGGVQAEDGTWSGQVWTPIGTATNSFGGNINGNSYNIQNMYVNLGEGSTNYGGMFGYILYSYNVSNINIASGYVCAYYAGGIAGCYSMYPSGTTEILNCIVNCEVKGNHAGGLFGISRYETVYDTAYIKNCSFSGSVTASKYAGGISRLYKIC